MFSTFNILAQNTAFFPNKEIQFWTEGMLEDDLVIFTVSLVGDGFVFLGEDCEYEISTMTPIIHEIEGDYIGENYFCNVSLPPTPSTDFTFMRGKLQIKAQYFGEDENYNGVSQYFYWDVADCNYYTPAGCGSFEGEADIIVKYSHSSGHNIYFAYDNGGPNLIWETVTGQTRRFIDYASEGTVPCQLTSIPTGLSVTGPVGGNPTISWNPNTEVGLGGYKLYRSIDGEPYLLLTILDAQTTSYVDQGVIVGNSRFDPAVCYTLSAFGNIDVESPKTFSKCIKYFGLNKEMENNETDNYENKLFDAYPNPFNPSTNISFQIKEYSFVTVKVYDILGNEIYTLINKNMEKGNHNIIFNASKLPSGVYFYLLETKNYYEAKMFNLLK